ncbi:hypothetical protein [Marinibactrum halimedae]|uniref:Uncharacterized protein n=1 Tax=Marinibactrum halimedae TaxID=1444977 RepID=A0AA37WM51_9GAMM|nr:hypothetical protein [Marinibactrum halimedae]MCD9461224.1 hypothetical protein [Marinibactrum halimedae]GLS24471.1 hypothetical protein GCM10007877_01820 [Marinibactrum halimedae]
MNNLILYRLSYFLPQGNLCRYFSLDLQGKNFLPIQDSNLTKNIKVKQSDGEWSRLWEVDYDGYYCVEKSLFSEQIEFAIYTLEDEDYFYFEGKSYCLESIELFYEKGFLLDNFSIHFNKKVLKTFKYLKPFWRDFNKDPLMDSEDIYPLRYVKYFIDERKWKREKIYREKENGPLLAS